MVKITSAQMRKIYGLAKVHNLDSETLHALVYKITYKESIKTLTIAEAIKVIDSLDGKKSGTAGMITYKQQRFIEGLAKDIGWKDGFGNLNSEKLNAWLHKRYGISHIRWLPVKKASDAIEGLKAMAARMGATAAQDAI